MRENMSRWKREADQLRRNHADNSAAVVAFVDLFERSLLNNNLNSPVVCLALHHVSMRFGKWGGKLMRKNMLKAELSDLPEAIFPKSRIPKRIPKR